MARVHLRALLCAVLIAALSTPSLAHFVWVVTQKDAPSGKSVFVYFGESPKPGEPDLLSYIEDVELTLISPTGETTPVALESAEDAMVSEADLGEGIVFGSKDLGEMSRGGSTFALKYHFKAGPHYGSESWAMATTKDHLPLDVVPRRSDGGDLVLHVMWNGEPLAGAEVICSPPGAPPEKSVSGEDGTFTLASPAPGRYGVRVKHAPEDPSVEVQARHYTTLTFEVQQAPSLRLSRGPDFPLAVSSHGAAFSDGSLYAFGGHAGVTHRYSTESTSGRFFRWKPNAYGTNEWEELASEVHLQGMGLLAFRGNLYRIGGARPRNAPGEEHDIRSVASCSIYRPETGKWESFRELPSPRSSFDAVVWNDHIVLVGGWEMRGSGEPPVWSDTALMLDLTQPDAEWQSIPQPFQRRALGCSVVDGKLYVVGGLTADGDVERRVDVLDLATMEWSEAPKLPGTRMNGFTPAVCSIGGRLIASPSDGRLYRLDESGTAWDEIGEIEESRFVHRMVPIDGRTVAIIGGASREGNRTSVEIVELSPAAFAAAVPSSSGKTASANVQEICPVMRDEFVFEDSHVVEFNGVEVRVCCETCEGRFAREPEAYLDVAILPQLQDAELPPRKIEQIYCPVYRERVVSSQDPSLEHDGKTIYFFSNSAKKRFVADPDSYPISDDLYQWSESAGSH
ncbi:MAG: kelch repeat-containing protein [Planctomycetota bacterium]